VLSGVKTPIGLFEPARLLVLFDHVASFITGTSLVQAQPTRPEVWQELRSSSQNLRSMSSADRVDCPQKGKKI